MAESFVKTMKRDYICVILKPDGLTAVKNPAEAFEHHNEWHPHSAPGYRSTREYLRRRTSNGVSDKKVYGNTGTNLFTFSITLPFFTRATRNELFIRHLRAGYQ
ncbi:hypothetical protein M942_24540 [Enterobacter ludwigii]|nr:hypothetical protein M942_24540 [Enterobacter ludwigii]